MSCGPNKLWWLDTLRNDITKALKRLLGWYNGLSWACFQYRIKLQSLSGKNYKSCPWNLRKKWHFCKIFARIFVWFSSATFARDIAVPFEGNKEKNNDLWENMQYWWLDGYIQPSNLSCFLDIISNNLGHAQWCVFHAWFS